MKPQEIRQELLGTKDEQFLEESASLGMGNMWKSMKKLFLSFIFFKRLNFTIKLLMNFGGYNICRSRVTTVQKVELEK